MPSFGLYIRVIRALVAPGRAAFERGRWSVLALFLGFWLPTGSSAVFMSAHGKRSRSRCSLACSAWLCTPWSTGWLASRPRWTIWITTFHLAYAVLIHRLPVGVTVWWMFRKDRLLAVGALMLVAAGTLVGFAQGDALLSRFSPQALQLVSGWVSRIVAARRRAPVLPPGEFDRKIPWAQWINGLRCSGDRLLLRAPP